MTKRRGNGEGTLFKRADGRWVGAVDLTGFGQRRRRKYVYASTQREAQSKLAQVRRTIERGAEPSPDRLTMQQFLETWLEDVARPTVRKSTFSSYESLVRLHIVLKLGRTPLNRLRPDHLNNLYREKTGESLSPRSVEYIHTVIRLALGKAEEWALVEPQRGAAGKAASCAQGTGKGVRPGASPSVSDGNQRPPIREPLSCGAFGGPQTRRGSRPQMAGHQL